MITSYDADTRYFPNRPSSTDIAVGRVLAFTPVSEAWRNRGAWVAAGWVRNAATSRDRANDVPRPG